MSDDLIAEFVAVCRDVLEASQSGVIYQRNATGDFSRQAANIVEGLESRLAAVLAKAEAR